MTPRQSDRLNELLDEFGEAERVRLFYNDRRDAILAFVDAELKAAKRKAKRTETT